MAGNEIYIGKIMSDMIDVLQETVVAISNINEVVSQGVSVLNVKGSSNHIYDFASDISFPVASSYSKVKNIKCMVQGSIRLYGTISATLSGGGTNNAYIGYSLDKGVTWVDMKSVTGTSGQTVTAIVDYDIPVNAGQDVWIGMKAPNNTYFTALKLLTGAYVGYDLIDIINDGGIIVS
ncbi:hypothetical protein [Sinanaerobacter chloroacetimidivorans]|uniref:Uncharacterized protein n=1 Tax=Sinanaerobacter chloroacetimidivorans TaxID=2818044 RepID=A0A8J7VZV8_9FIRM|nr:hypothetical protein [Sinanaerobacter chloroacetimidivorans]MBR0596596.1 hypothetical protein [Sinanaerobacter chloroacetimidivorans]